MARLAPRVWPPPRGGVSGEDISVALSVFGAQGDGRDHPVLGQRGGVQCWCCAWAAPTSAEPTAKPTASVAAAACPQCRHATVTPALPASSGASSS
mmetsp:Transcript_4041/g.11925  ORF Transcript_4041/g.11925 Transcript_4041/m.11925 type:complete len:96 (+) Transcript_4041:195-482(+)